MTIRYNYNRQVSPPAPFIHVTVSRPRARETVVANFPAQLDTAADFSVLPAAVVERLQLLESKEVAIAGFGGHISVVPTFYASLQIHELPAITISVIADREEPFILLGRDVLNRFQIVLDGPGLFLEIQT